MGEDSAWSLPCTESARSQSRGVAGRPRPTQLHAVGYGLVTGVQPVGSAEREPTPSCPGAGGRTDGRAGDFGGSRGQSGLSQHVKGPSQWCVAPVPTWGAIGMCLVRPEGTGAPGPVGGCAMPGLPEPRLGLLRRRRALEDPGCLGKPGSAFPSQVRKNQRMGTFFLPKM